MAGSLDGGGTAWCKRSSGAKAKGRKDAKGQSDPGHRSLCTLRFDPQVFGAVAGLPSAWPEQTYGRRYGFLEGSWLLNLVSRSQVSS